MSKAKAIKKIKEFLQEKNIKFDDIKVKEEIFGTFITIKIGCVHSVIEGLLDDEKWKAYQDEKQFIRELECKLWSLTDFEYSIYFDTM